MNITITVPSKSKYDGFRVSVTEQLRRSLARFSNRIDRVDVALTDENGTRGGVDKQCRIRVQMPGIGEIATTAIDECPWAAVVQAALRARRKMVTRLKRPRSQRERYRRNRWRNSDTPAL